MTRIAAAVSVALILAVPMAAEGGCLSSARRNCRPCGSQVVRWYRAKDGTLRQMIPYREALSRAEDADNLEIELKSVRTELEQTAAALESKTAEAADTIARLQQEIAALKTELAQQTQRAEKAEASLKTAREQAEAASAELKTVRADLQKSVDTLTEENRRLTAQLQESQQQIRNLQNAATETKKPEITEEETPDASAKEKPAGPGQGSENETPEDSVSEERTPDA